MKGGWSRQRLDNGPARLAGSYIDQPASTLQCVPGAFSQKQSRAATPCCRISRVSADRQKALMSNMQAPPDYSIKPSSSVPQAQNRPGTPDGHWRASDGKFYSNELKPGWQNGQVGQGQMEHQSVLPPHPSHTVVHACNNKAGRCQAEQVQVKLQSTVPRLILGGNIMTLLWRP